MAADAHLVTSLKTNLSDPTSEKSNHLLKAGYDRLHDEFNGVQEELKSVLKELHSVQTTSAQALQNARKEILNYQQQIKDLQAKSLSHHQLESIKFKAKEKAEKKFVPRLIELEHESERWREESKRISYENTVLKTELESCRSQHTVEVEEIVFKHKTEVVELEREKSELEMNLRTVGSQEEHLVRSKSRENAQLQRGISSLSAEVEELRRRLLMAEEQNGELQRQLAKEAGENTTRLRTLENDRSVAQTRSEQMQRDLNRTVNSETRLRQQVAELQQSNTELSVELNEKTQQAKLDRNSSQLQVARVQTELERETAALNSLIEDLRAKLTLLQETSDKQSLRLIEKDREMTEKMQENKRKYEETIAKFKHERSEFEEKVKKLQEVDRSSVAKQEVAEVREKLQATEGAKSSLENELQDIRLKMKMMELNEAELERERLVNTELRQQTVGLKRELVTQAETLKKKAEEEAAKCKKEAEEDMNKLENALLQRSATDKLAMESEKRECLRRIEFLEEQLQNDHQQHHRESKANKKRISAYTRHVSSLQKKLELARAENEKLRLEKQGMEKNVPADVHSRLKKHLRALQQRQEQFRQVLNGGGGPAQTILALTPRLGETTFPTFNPAFQWATSQQEWPTYQIEMIKQRVDRLHSDNHKQLEDLIHSMDKELDLQNACPSK